MKTIDEYKKALKGKDIKYINFILEGALRKIKFLESIYMTGGDNNFYGERFSNCALQERRELCQLSSACYSILRDKAKRS